MKRLFAIMTVLIIVAAIPVMGQAQDEGSKPPPEIPAPAGATVTTEMNVTRDQIMDLLPMYLNQSYPDLQIDPEKLDKALGTVERVQFAEMKLNGKYTAADTLALFEKKVDGNRVIYNCGKDTPESGMLILALPQNSGYFAVAIKAEKNKSNKTTGAEIKAIRISGCPDIAKVIELIAPAIPQVIGKGFGEFTCELLK
ncbi:MAG: hypothetical protein ABFD64_03395 [Armatimonadota bacterium]